MPITRPVSILNPERFNLGQLTPSETLWLWRHRQRSPSGRIKGRAGRNMNQQEAAARLGISKRSYVKLETGGNTRLSANEVVEMQRVLQTLGTLEPPPSTAELCLLARRRSGMNLEQVAVENLRITRQHYLSIEPKATKEVVKFWTGLGYRFPKPGLRVTTAPVQPGLPAG